MHNKKLILSHINNFQKKDYDEKNVNYENTLQYEIFFKAILMYETNESSDGVIEAFLL